VSCEGYEYPEDPYILKGSCALEYSLKGVDPRSSHNDNQDRGYYNDYDDSQRQGGSYYEEQQAPRYSSGHNYHNKHYDNSTEGGSGVWLGVILMIGVVYLAYKIFGSGNSGNDGDGNNGSNYPPPPGPPPLYSQTPHSTFRSRPGSGYTKPTGRYTTGSSPSSGAGFGTGAAMGAAVGGLAGYAAGRASASSSSYSRPQSRFNRPNNSYASSYNRPTPVRHPSPARPRPAAKTRKATGFSNTARR